MIDRVEIYVKGGDGGDGVVSFRHEKFVALGGPDGGNGGEGGSVYLVAGASISTLREFASQRHFRAEKGRNGSGKKKQGRKGGDLLLMVPVGTLVQAKEYGREAIVGDLTEEGQRLLVAKGGRGGWGNAHFATATNRAPRIAQKGQRGEERWLVLDLKLLADVGIIGYPNVGKSTLLAAVSAARPKIADYPFTTTEPVLGVVEVGNRAFVLADIPGLISGAYRGQGLGHEFLRHIERTKLLLHLLDGTHEDPVADLASVNEELALFDSALRRKPQLVAVNKIDLPEVRERLPLIEKELKESDPASLFFISAANKEGVGRLMARAAEMLGAIGAGERLEVPYKVFYPKAVDERAERRPPSSVSGGG